MFVDVDLWSLVSEIHDRFRLRCCLIPLSGSHTLPRFIHSSAATSKDSAGGMCSVLADRWVLDDRSVMDLRASESLLDRSDGTSGKSRSARSRERCGVGLRVGGSNEPQALGVTLYDADTQRPRASPAADASLYRAGAAAVNRGSRSRGRPDGVQVPAL